MPADSVLPASIPAGGADRRRRLGGALLVCAVAALLILPAVGRQYITSSDEARFVLIARDMLQRGVWFDAVVREKHYRNKPPLYPWSIAALARLGAGVTETTAGLPVALAAVTAALCTFLLGEALFGLRAGIAAGLILTTSYSFFQHSLEVLPDMLVVAFATVAGWAFWRSASTQTPRRRGWLVLLWAAVAMGCFSKGPVGLLPLLPAGVWLWTEGGPAALRRLWSLPGTAVFVLITLVWVAPFVGLGASSFASNVVVGNWLSWYLGVPSLDTLGNALLDGVVGFLPWAVPAVLAFPLAWGTRRQPAVRFALLSTIVPLVVVLLAENQRRRYLLPVYPGAALIVAWWATSRLEASPLARRAVAWLGLGAAAAGIAAHAVLGRSPDWFVGVWSWPSMPIYVALAGLGAALFVGLHQARPDVLVGGTATAMLLLLGWAVHPYSAWVNRTQDFPQLAARLERHARGGDAAVYGGRYFPLDFYLGRPLVRLRDAQQLNEYLARPDAPPVVLDNRAWHALQDQIARPVVELDVVRVRAWDMRVVRRADAAPAGTPR
ncbi:MAG TPA: glycosyltransferase family 39 protein [Methylomirabilota bacterium]|nr:glycosyltransferase family 39 protein [Methylomirabilota bacterium]